MTSRKHSESASAAATSAVSGDKQLVRRRIKNTRVLSSIHHTPDPAKDGSTGDSGVATGTWQNSNK